MAHSNGGAGGGNDAPSSSARLPDLRMRKPGLDDHHPLWKGRGTNQGGAERARRMVASHAKVTAGLVLTSVVMGALWVLEALGRPRGSCP